MQTESERDLLAAIDHAHKVTDHIRYAIYRANKSGVPMAERTAKLYAASTTVFEFASYLETLLPRDPVTIL